MSAHVLLNLLNELGKRDKIHVRGLPSILSLFRNEFNKFNNARARMIDSIYHMTNTLKVSKVSKIRNRYNQVPHLTQDTNGKVTNSQKTPIENRSSSDLKCGTRHRGYPETGIMEGDCTD